MTIGKTATTIARRGNVVTVTYHTTCIVAADLQAMAVTLDSGGWRTATTKRRMNQAATQFGLGFSVFQRWGNWFVTTCLGELEFHDGMIIDLTTGKLVPTNGELAKYPKNPEPFTVH